MFNLRIGGKIPEKKRLRNQIIQLQRDATKGVPGARKKLKEATDRYNKM